MVDVIHPKHSIFNHFFHLMNLHRASLEGTLNNCACFRTNNIEIMCAIINNKSSHNGCSEIRGDQMIDMPVTRFNS